MLTHPLFLLGLLGVGIPIAIHLLQLRRYRKVYFSNVVMLQELQNENRRQNNLRRLLILAARILFVVFLVLAFCQPVVRRPQGRQQPGGTAVSVYIDNSFSMECGGMDGSLVESAKQKAREIAAAYRPGDQFQLLTNDASGGQFRWLSREEFLSAVEDLKISPVTVPLSAIATRQNDFLRSSPAANRHAYLLSDFQQSTADIASCPSDSAVQPTFIHLEGTKADNLFIDSIAFDCPAYFPGASVQVRATVKNYGGSAVEEVPLRLFVEGRQRALASVDIAAGSSATATLAFTIDQAGPLQGYVETTDYPITFDDRCFFTLDVRSRTPMLAIGEDENPFLRRLFEGDSLVCYRTTVPTQVDYTRLTDHNFIVLNELRTIPSGLAQALTTFAEQGGTLLAVPARDADPDTYNQLLAALHAPLIGPWKGEKARAAAIDFDHDLFRGVFRGRHDEAEMPTADGFFRLTAPQGTAATPVIRLNSGDGYLTATPCGGGRVYLFAGPLRPEYTDFVQQALFVPALYNMALFASPRTAPCHSLSCADPIRLARRYDPDRPPHLTARPQPGQKRAKEGADLIPDLRTVGGIQFLVPHGEVAAAGNYHLAAPSDTAAEGLSFNYSRQESELDFYSRAELKGLLREAGIANAEVAPNARKSMEDYVRRRTEGTPLWRWCLLAALLCLLAETALIRLSRGTHTS